MSKEEEDRLAPRLAALRQRVTTPEPPEGYWEEMTEQVLRQTTDKSAHTTRLRHLWPVLRVAASVLLLLVAGWWWLLRPTPEMASLEEIDEQEIKAYVMANLDEFDWEWLLVHDAPAALSLPELAPEEIEDYLDDDFDSDWLHEEDLF